MSDEIISNTINAIKTVNYSSTCDAEQVTDNKFVNPSIHITENEITVNNDNTADSTKTRLPVVLCNNTVFASKSAIVSKIPVSPELSRRKSTENVSTLTVGKLTTFNRKIPTYRSMRKKHQYAEDNDNWNNKTLKQRPIVVVDTVETTLNNTEKIYQNSPSRSSFCDKNGSKAKPPDSLTENSSTKESQCSTLAQQLIETAASAQSDTQIIFKVKELLSKYSDESPGPSTADVCNNECNDFTAEWIENNGTINHACNNETKRCSTTFTPEEISCKDVPSVTSPRRGKVMSKIPAPVRSNTGLY